MKKQLKNKFFILFISSFAFVGILFISLNTISVSNKSSFINQIDFSSKSENQKNEFEIDKIETPIYFSVFKFFLDFIPIKKTKEITLNKSTELVSKILS